MNIIYKLALWTLFMSIAILCTRMAYVEYHEYIHQDIFDDYNISSRVERYYNPLKWFDDNYSLGSTYYSKDCPTETCEMQHNLLEIADYIVVSLMYFVLFGGMAVIVYQEVTKPKTINNINDDFIIE